MPNREVATVALLGWNPFQIARYLRLCRYLPGSVVVVEKREDNLHAFDFRTLEEAHVPYLVWESDRLNELDGAFDVLVCQTLFPRIESFRKTKLAMLQYGLAKEPHNYGAWRSLADLCLAYGPYSAARMSHFCPAEAVGNPHFDQWSEPEFIAKAKARYGEALDPARKTVLYVPTWGALSTQRLFLDSVLALSERYNVWVKLHHNTDLLEGLPAKTSSSSARWFCANDDILELLCLADAVVSDYSGAIFDAIYCGVPVVLAQAGSESRFGRKLNLYSLEYARRDEIGPCVDAPEQLLQVMERVFSGELSYTERNRQLSDELFTRGPGSCERAAAALGALARDRPPRPVEQTYIRDELRVAYLRHQALADRPLVSAAASLSGVDSPERRILDRWVRQGKHRRVLRYAAVRAKLAPSLSVFRAGIRAAYAVGDRGRVASLAQAARRHFPNSIVGEVPQQVIGSAPVNSSGKPVRTASEPNRPRKNEAGQGGTAARRLSLEALEEALPTQAHGYAAIALANAYRRRRQVLKAYQTLMKAQQSRSRDKRLLHAIARLLLHDGQIIRAYLFFLMASRLGCSECAAAQLYLESQMGWQSDGYKSLQRMLAWSPQTLLPVLSNLNRAAAYYPDARDQLASARRSARDYNYQRPARRPWTSTDAIHRAIDNRWLDQAEALAKARRRASSAGRRLRAVMDDLGPLSSMVEIAWRNEEGAELLALDSSGRTSSVSNRAARRKLVELFIPTVFFTHRTTDKSSYATIRRAFRSLTEELLARDDIDLVPRLQLSWRHATPRTSGYVISYHTHGSFDPKRLHLQESTLSGFVSVDQQGYAGYSSLATRPALIDEITEGVSYEAMDNYWKTLHERFVENNLSKYAQAKRGRPPLGRYVFLPLQVVTDDVAQLAYIDQLSLLETLVEALRGSGTAVVVKRHPYCQSMKMERALDDLLQSSKVIVSSASIHDLIEGADAVYTVNSGVGLEALLHRKPVVATGLSEYTYAAQVVASREDLVKTARHGVRQDYARTARFLYAYAKSYLIDPSLPRSFERILTTWFSGRPLAAAGSRLETPRHE